MNEIIETFVKKIRKNTIGEEEIKAFSKEFCQIMRDCQIIDKLNDLKILKDFFGIKIEHVKDPIRCCRIWSRGSFFSKDNLVVLYIDKNFPEKREILALKYAIMFYLFRLKDKTKASSPQEMNFEIPILKSTKVSIGEKIFLYNLMIPCDRFIELYEEYCENDYECDSSYELAEKWITHLIINTGIPVFIIPKIEEFFHEAFFDDLKKVTQTQTS